jgi:hypothetical protein
MEQRSAGAGVIAVAGRLAALPLATRQWVADDIRNYTGEATVRDVVGRRIGGRFVVDASDTSSPDDGGGVLVGVDGRRWVRQCDFVS